MSLFTQPLEAVTEQDIQDLVDAKFAEWKTVEYKESLSVNSDSERKKFLSQVSSFANASGGHLIYGVRATNGVPEELQGMEADNPDGMVLRLEEIIRTGIRPRVPGVLVRAVPVKANRVAILIRIPKSWAKPHQVIFNNEFRFYSRASNGKHILDVDELRSLFALSETAAERLRNFRASRLSQVIAGETPARMDDKPKIVLHAVPLGAFEPAAKFDLKTVINDTGLLRPMSASGWNGPRYNFDGIYTFTTREGFSYGYLQVFRDGIIEAVDSSLLDPKFDGKIIPSVAYEKSLIEALKRCLELQQRIGVEPPIIVMLSLLGVKGYVMAVSRSRHYDDGHPIDRDALVIPETLVDSFDVPEDKAMRPVLDPVWNAAGLPHSINFDDEDNWKPHE